VRGQLVPENSGAPASRGAGDDFVAGDDEVDLEVVIGCGQLLVEDLERVDRCGDDRAGSEEAGVVEEGDL
jgi:hypothetical protein